MVDTTMRISTFDQLPDWYRFENYSGLEKADAERWWLLTDQRKKILSDLRLIEVGESFTAVVNDERRASVLEDFLKLATRPLSVKEKSFQAYVERSCHWPTYKELQTHINLFEPTYKTKSKLQYTYPGEVPLLLNMELSDRTLIKRLQELLSEFRNEQNDMRRRKGFGRTARVRKYDISKWPEIGLLPYIDLRLWERIVLSQITWSVISEATCQPGEGSVDQTRKTVEPLSQELFFVGNGRADLERLMYPE